jgi:hypothetical protein
MKRVVAGTEVVIARNTLNVARTRTPGQIARYKNPRTCRLYQTLTRRRPNAGSRAIRWKGESGGFGTLSKHLPH